MRFLTSVPPLLLLAAGCASAASSWSFQDGSLSVSNKRGGAEPIKETLTPKSPLSKPVPLASTATLRVTLTPTEGGKAKRPHQAFLLLREPATGLEAPFPLIVRETGKGNVDLALKDIPAPLLLSSSPLEATLVLGSFGEGSKASLTPLFSVEVQHGESDAPLAAGYEAPIRYGKLPEIHHIFRADPKSPPKIISAVFTLAVVAALPALFLAWLLLGANASHLPAALSAAPLSHAAFLGSIVAMEAVFYLYYSTWTLFQILPLMVGVGAVTFLSGSKALGEVQARRLAGQR